MPRILKSVSLSLLLLPLLLLALGSYEREAKRLADLMNWKPGQVIAEIGAGEGQMSFFAAQTVGADGHIYTTELDDKKLDNLKKEVKQRNLGNVTVVKADPIQTNLPDDCCDAVFMRRVYHHFTDPTATDASLLRALKPGGLLAVIDFAPHAGLPPVQNAPHNHGGHGIEKNTLITELTSAGFEIVAQPKDWPNHGDGDYCVIARKPAAPKPS
ncbi:MAG: methyltransferase domain-containing protein [Acidobacteriaceae bacterium]|nr:methyltransferase domain-containing protein [Acidobacteriaceae bacterium]MBV9035381.1 methyltransferase domain-containing protein [Acidobacteriaceae bacterium]MBV9227638.1 methyltransferase domain-containing protein [Acidobacteriaceae bacterium]MBV9308709.1 methyltransferase domain-containing protein [Acidobacteriaceae bacterium]